MYYFFIFFFIAPCQTIRVILKNEVLLNQGTRQGIYERSTDINERPSWIHTTKSEAIWYMSKWKKWAIGSLSDIGTDTRGISGLNKDAPSLPYETISWEYWTGSSFEKESAFGDTSVQCVVGNAYHQL